MGFVTDFVSDIFGGDDAADATRDAARLDAEYQQQALDYLKEREEIPRQFSEGALSILGGLAGIEGGTGSQADLIDRARTNPLYDAILGTRDAGEDAIARYASATGGLRSGNLNENLYDFNQRLEERALLDAYNAELQPIMGLAGLPSNANAIAQQTSNVGSTLSSGIIGAEQARQDALGLGINTLGTGAALLWSDPRLKESIEPVGILKGYQIYKWVWNALASQLGLSGEGYGVMAHEVPSKAVTERQGYLMVDYKKLGLV